MAGQEGTKDISTDLQQRTNIKPADKMLIVNSDTGELNYVPVSDSSVGGGGSTPTPSDETFIII